MKSHMEIMVEYFLVARSFPVTEVYEAIGLDGEQEHQERKVFSTPSGKDYVRQENDSITYSTGYIKAADVRIPLMMIYNMVSKRTRLIKTYIDKYKLRSKFCIVINLTDNPTIIFPKKFLRLVHSLNAEIEVDSYI